MKLVDHENPLDASHCQLCARYHSDPLFRALIDGGKEAFYEAKKRGVNSNNQPVNHQRKPPDCIHPGPVLPLQPKCGCAEKLRKCDLKGQCRVGVEKDGVACCRTCKDFETDDYTDI